MDWKEELIQRTKETEEIILRYLPKAEGRQAEIMNAMEYSVLVGGKRLRPIFIMECCKMFGGDVKEAAPFMAAMEFIHTYSLVHDDLPEMDNDELRRGKPTTHVKYGQAMAVLAGDALLNYAYEIVADAMTKTVCAENAVKAFAVLSRHAGIYGMVGGQVIDVSTEGQVNDKETLDNIYVLKTGALIKASMLIGSILGGAQEAELETVERVADKVGMAFQIQDDILDVTSTTGELGKPVLSDEKNKKFTYVSLLGVEDACGYVRRLSKEALEELRKLNRNSEFIEKLIQFLVDRRK